MKDFKLWISGSKNRGRPFPEHRRLGPGEAGRLQLTLSEGAGAGHLGGAALLGHLFGRSRPVEGASTDSKDFDLTALASSLGLVPGREVYQWIEASVCAREPRCEQGFGARHLR